MVGNTLDGNVSNGYAGCILGIGLRPLLDRAIGKRSGNIDFTGSGQVVVSVAVGCKPCQLIRYVQAAGHVQRTVHIQLRTADVCCCIGGIAQTGRLGEGRRICRCAEAGKACKLIVVGAIKDKLFPANNGECTALLHVDQSAGQKLIVVFQRQGSTVHDFERKAISDGKLKL